MKKNDEPTNRELLIHLNAGREFNEQEFGHIRESIDDLKGMKKRVDANTRWRYFHTGAYALAGFFITTFWNSIKAFFTGATG